MQERKYGFDTLMIHAGQASDPTTGSVTTPIYQTSAYEFQSSQHAADLFALKAQGKIYTRMHNPTTDILEERVSALDGGIGGLALASGHAAISLIIMMLASAGDEIVSSTNIYGGAVNLIGISLKKLGITPRFVKPDGYSAVEAAINDKTKCLFVEMVGNPNADVADVERLAQIAHNAGIPLIVDSTCTTPYLAQPIKWGADIVVHSATKFLGGHGTSMCGIVVDSGNFNWDNPRFPDYISPDTSYHGVVFAKDMGRAGFIARMRVLGLRDFGACPSPFNSFLILQGIETLSLRMRKHCDNALAVAKFLEGHPDVTFVNYPGLESSSYHELAKKYLPKGAGALITFGLKGGRAAGAKFIDSVRLFKHVTNIGDVRSLVSHPATTTHSQLSDEQLEQAGITPETVRLSIGLEDADDLIYDLDQAIAEAKKP